MNACRRRLNPVALSKPQPPQRKRVSQPISYYPPIYSYLDNQHSTHLFPDAQFLPTPDYLGGATLAKFRWRINPAPPLLQPQAVDYQGLYGWEAGDLFQAPLQPAPQTPPIPTPTALAAILAEPG